MRVVVVREKEDQLCPSAQNVLTRKNRKRIVEKEIPRADYFAVCVLFANSIRYIDGHKRIGAVLFIASYTVACTLFLPGSLFTIGAGFLFKPFPLALLIVLLGDVFAAVGSFIFGRYVFYDWVKSMMSKHPKFNALDQVIQDDGMSL